MRSPFHGMMRKGFDKVNSAVEEHAFVKLVSKDFLLDATRKRAGIWAAGPTADSFADSSESNTTTDRRASDKRFRSREYESSREPPVSATCLFDADLRIARCAGRDR